MSFRKKWENDDISEGNSSKRTLRLMKRHEVKDTSELDEKLKGCGMLDDGMTNQQKKELLLVIAESKKSAIVDAQFLKEEEENPDYIPPTYPDCGNDSNAEVVLESPLSENVESTEENDEKFGFSSNVGYFAAKTESTKAKCKYKLEDINPLDVTKDVIDEPCLKDKRKMMTSQVRLRNGLFSVLQSFSKRTFIKSFEAYHRRLYSLQHESLDILPWGDPVVVGRHCDDTLDKFNRAQQRKNMQNLVDCEDFESDASEKPIPTITNLPLKGSIRSYSIKVHNPFDLEDAPSDTHPTKSASCSTEKKLNSMECAEQKKNLCSDLEAIKIDSSFTKNNPNSLDCTRQKKRLCLNFETTKRDNFHAYNRQRNKLCFDLERTDGDANSDEEFDRLLYSAKVNRNWKIPKRKQFTDVTAESQSVSCDTSLDDDSKPCSMLQSTTIRESDHVEKSSDSMCSSLPSSKELRPQKKLANKNLPLDSLMSSDLICSTEGNKTITGKNVDTIRTRKSVVKVNRNKVGLERAKSQQSKVYTSDDNVLQISSCNSSPEDELDISTVNESTALQKFNLRELKSSSLRREATPLPANSFYKRQRLHDNHNNQVVISSLAAREKSELITGHGKSAERSVEQSSIQQDANMDGQSESMACPLCNKFFEKSKIEAHASDCQGISSDDSEVFPFRTPKHKQRCYICRGVFQEQSYRDHVKQCLGERRIRKQCDTSTVSPASSNILNANSDVASSKVDRIIQEEAEFFNSKNSLFNYLSENDSHGAKMAVACNVSPDGVQRNARLDLRGSLQHDDCSENGNFSMNHLSTPPLSTFQPISQQKNALIDFKNQFVVHHKTKLRNGGQPKKRVTKKRRSKNGKSRKRHKS